MSVPSVIKIKRGSKGGPSPRFTFGLIFNCVITAIYTSLALISVPGSFGIERGSEVGPSPQT